MRFQGQRKDCNFLYFWLGVRRQKGKHGRKFVCAGQKDVVYVPEHRGPLLHGINGEVFQVSFETEPSLFKGWRPLLEADTKKMLMDWHLIDIFGFCLQVQCERQCGLATRRREANSVGWCTFRSRVLSGQYPILPSLCREKGSYAV